MSELNRSMVVCYCHCSMVFCYRLLLLLFVMVVCYCYCLSPRSFLKAISCNISLFFQLSVESILIHHNNDFAITPFTWSPQSGVEVDVKVLAISEKPSRIIKYLISRKEYHSRQYFQSSPRLKSIKFNNVTYQSWWFLSWLTKLQQLYNSVMRSPSHERKFIELDKTFGYLQNNELQIEGFWNAFKRAQQITARTESTRKT